MSWLSSLFQHNKAWILPIAAAAAGTAGVSLAQGHLNMTAVAGAVLTTVGTLAKSPLGKSGSGDGSVAGAIVSDVVGDVAGGAPIGTKTLAAAAESVAAESLAANAGVRTPDLTGALGISTPAGSCAPADPTSAASVGGSVGPEAPVRGDSSPA